MRGGGHLPLHPSLHLPHSPPHRPIASPSGAVAARGAGSRRPARGGSGPVTHLELRSPQPGGGGGGPCRSVGAGSTLPAPFSPSPCCAAAARAAPPGPAAAAAPPPLPSQPAPRRGAPENGARGEAAAPAPRSLTFGELRGRPRGPGGLCWPQGVRDHPQVFVPVLKELSACSTDVASSPTRHS